MHDALRMAWCGVSWIHIHPSHKIKSRVDGGYSIKELGNARAVSFVSRVDLLLSLAELEGWLASILLRSGRWNHSNLVVLLCCFGGGAGGVAGFGA